MKEGTSPFKKSKTNPTGLKTIDESNMPCQLLVAVVDECPDLWRGRWLIEVHRIVGGDCWTKSTEIVFRRHGPSLVRRRVLHGRGVLERQWGKTRWKGEGGEVRGLQGRRCQGLQTPFERVAHHHHHLQKVAAWHKRGDSCWVPRGPERWSGRPQPRRRPSRPPSCRHFGGSHPSHA